MRSRGLSEAILSRHHGPYPVTQHTNQTNTPIDGIFASAGVRVMAGGYLDFHQYFQSDHRGLWIDIDLWATLGRAKPKPSFPIRRLNTLDSRSVRRYLRIAEEGYLHFDIPRRLGRFMQDSAVQHGTLTAAQIQAFNVLHSHAYSVRRKAEKGCRKLAMGGVPYSPPLQRKWDQLRLWDLLLKGHQGIRTSSRKIRRLMKKTGLLEDWKLSVAELESKLVTERQSYKRAKVKRASHLRKDHITVRSSAPARANTKMSKYRLRISRSKRMAQKEETRRRRKAQGKGFSGGLMKIQVLDLSDDSKSWLTCTSRKLVEEGCMQENQSRYDQTRHPYPTPPMSEPLYSMFNGPSAHAHSLALLNGTFESPSSDPLLQSFVNQCHRPEKLTDLPLTVSMDDHVYFWSRMKEQKGSEPHGLHNGHFKAGATSPMLAQCDSFFRSLPFSVGFVPSQWQHLMNFAIEKKPGEIRVTKMRTIQMMNSEFQANNKLVGKEAMKYAEKNSLIPVGQCGARKEHQAIDLALSKRLTWDLLILQRRAAGFVSNDAKSCFDRIVHWVAIVSLMRFGIPWLALRSMFDTLMSSAHRVRTGFGDSSRVFRPPSSIPFQGCGQGNGAGPTIWVAVSSILLGMMISQGFGFESLVALSGLAVIANCFAFIDDTDICQAGPSVEHRGEQVLPEVQRALDWWSTGIRLTGGALNPAKCFWWLIDFRWDSSSGKWKFRRQADFTSDSSSPIRLSTADLDGSLVNLPWLEPDQSERTLGVMMAPLSCASAQLKVLKEKALKWADTVRSGHILHYDALPMLKTTIMKTVEYPMALTTFSSAEWESVLSPDLMSLLPKAGICRTFPRAVVYAPLRFQGLGVPHPFGTQMGKHLDMLLPHSANQTATGTFLAANLEAHQVETGTSYGIFQQEYCNTGILASDTWVKRVWRLLDEHRVHVEFDSPSLALQRQGDVLLMEAFIEAEVDQETLLWLNWCRMHLHAVTLSDIVTADGRRISHAAWSGRRDGYRVDRYNWPRTARPTTTWWSVWQKWILVLFLGSSKSTLSLLSPLGPWLSDSGWRWKFSPAEHWLFHLEGGGWVEARLSSHRLSSRNFLLRRAPPPPGAPLFVSDLPLDCKLASVHRSGSSSSVTLLGLGTFGPSSASSPTLVLDLWHSYRSQISGSYGWVPETLSIQGDESRLLASFKAGSLRVICDGSYKHGLGSACSQLCTLDGSDRIWIYCQSPGLTADQSSTRSGLVGILASMIALDWLAQVAKLRTENSHPTVELGCDGLVALRKCFDPWPLQPSSRQFDIALTVRALIRESPLSIQARHVKGHADLQRPLSQLTWWELRNRDVDSRAQAFRQSLESRGSPTPRNPRFFSEPAALFLDGVKQSRLSVPSILEFLAARVLHEYWADQTRSRITPLQFSEVDWNSVGRAMHSLPPYMQRWTTKHMVGMCGVGKFRKLWKYDTDSSCPRCTLCKKEDHRHVIRCTGDSAVKEWDLRFSSLLSWMEGNSTAPEITLVFSAFLSSIREPSTVLELDSIQSSHPSILRAAVRSQAIIGAQGLIEGLLSTQWSKLQQLHFDSLSSSRSVSLWSSRLVQQLLSLGYHMWTSRNSVQHSEDNTRYLGCHREVDRGIREQYAMGKHNAPPRVCTMLKEAIHSVLNRSLEEREHWRSLASRERARHRRSLARQRQMIYVLRSRGPPTRACSFRPST